MFTIFSGNMNLIYILIYIVAYFMALFIAMPFHEFAHAFAAKREGDYTAVAYKRYTLAPLAHVDLSGLLFLFLFGFGWAKPVPVDERNFKRGRKSKFLVAIAGIVTNLILGIIFLFVYVLLLKICPNFLVNNYYGILLETFLLISISLNFLLAFFNLLPIYPLDGFRIIQSFTGPNNGFVNFMSRYSFIIYIILLLSGALYIYYSYTAELLIEVLLKLFCKILGVWNVYWR